MSDDRLARPEIPRERYVHSRSNPCSELVRKIGPRTCETENGLERVSDKKKARPSLFCDQREDLDLQVGSVLKLIHQNPRELRRDVGENFGALLKKNQRIVDDVGEVDKPRLADSGPIRLRDLGR